MRWLIGSVAVLGFSCGDKDKAVVEAAAPVAAAAAVAPTVDPALVARGKYLMDHVSACIECHTPRGPDNKFDMTRYMAGVDCFIDVDPTNPNVGCVNTRNLTNDETGLKSRTDEQIKDAFLNGKRVDGTFLTPFMPYWVYHNMHTEDADAIVAYIRTIPGIDHTVAPQQPPFDQTPAPPPNLNPDTDIPKTATTSPQIEHGRYLATQVGVCIECHTKHNPPGPGPILDTAHAFAGGEGFGAAAFRLPVPPFPAMIYTANITPDATGLKGWVATDIMKVLGQGLDEQGKPLCPPMPGGPDAAYGGLTGEDQADIAAYILALAPIANKIPNDCDVPMGPPPAP